MRGVLIAFMGEQREHGIQIAFVRDIGVHTGDGVETAIRRCARIPSLLVGLLLCKGTLSPKLEHLELEGEQRVTIVEDAVAELNTARSQKREGGL